MSTILRVKDVSKYINLSRSMIYLMINEKSEYYNPAFPKPIHLSLRARGWLKADIDTYLQLQSQKANAAKVAEPLNN